jgi:hypothetical protein
MLARSLRYAKRIGGKVQLELFLRRSEVTCVLASSVMALLDFGSDLRINLFLRTFTNNRRRWIVPWKDSRTKPAIYHCISRVVGRGLLLGEAEREHFRMLMRMCEKFTGCRVLSYCLMSNHFHLLLEVPPMPEGGISDAEFFERLGVFYNEARVAEIRKEMADACMVRVRGEFELPPVDESGRVLDPAEEEAMAKYAGGEAAWRKSATATRGGCTT